MATRFILSIFLLAALANAQQQAVSLTRKPTLSLQRDGIVITSNLVQTVEYTKEKYQATLFNFQKNEGVPYPGTPKLDLSRGPHQSSKRDGKLPLKPLSGSALWAGNITVGGQPFRIDFDTGSSDLWIPSVNCTSAACKCMPSATNQCDVKYKYDCKKSKTCIPYPSKSFSISYVDGSGVRGSQYNDTVVLAGISGANTTFSAVDTMDTTLDGDQVDGILGMGYQAISNLRQRPVFQNLYARSPRSFSNNMFSFFFSDADSGSELYLGGVNEAKLQRPIYFQPVTKKAYWQIGGGAAVVNGQTTISNQQVIVDTGTTLIYAPNNTVAQIFAPVQGARYWQDGYWTFPCRNQPTIGWRFSTGPAFNMSPSSLNLGQTYYGSPDCVSAIVGQSFAGDAILMGDAFLKNVYTTFSLGNDTVGFAALAPPSTTTIKPTLALQRGTRTATPTSSSTARPTAAASASDASSDIRPTLSLERERSIAGPRRLA